MNRGCVGRSYWRGEDGRGGIGAVDEGREGTGSASTTRRASRIDRREGNVQVDEQSGTIHLQHRNRDLHQELHCEPWREHNRTCPVEERFLLLVDDLHLLLLLRVVDEVVVVLHDVNHSLRPAREWKKQREMR